MSAENFGWCSVSRYDVGHVQFELLLGVSRELGVGIETSTRFDRPTFTERLESGQEPCLIFPHRDGDDGLFLPQLLLSALFAASHSSSSASYSTTTIPFFPTRARWIRTAARTFGVYISGRWILLRFPDLVSVLTLLLTDAANQHREGLHLTVALHHGCNSHHATPPISGWS